MILDNKLIIENGINLYNETIKHANNKFERVKFNEREKLFHRFYNLLKNKNQGISILDIGCGNGLLVDFINSIGFRCSYYEGWDINDNLLDEAKKSYPNLSFKNIDIFSNNASSEFDLVVICGLFNCNMGQTEEWCLEFLRKAFEFVNKTGALSFNAISTYVNFQEESMFYLEPEQVMRFCISNLSKRVNIEHHDLPYNYTVDVFKQSDSMELK